MRVFLRSSSDSSVPLPRGLSNPKHILERRVSQDVVGAPGFVEKQTDKTPTLNDKNSYSSPLTLFLIILLNPGSSKKQKHSKNTNSGFSFYWPCFFTPKVQFHCVLYQVVEVINRE